MLSLTWEVLATLLLLPLSFAQTEGETQQYTVWASAIFLRNGETTPSLLYPQTLTSLGAQQAFSAGDFFRERYISDGLWSNARGVQRAPLNGLAGQLLAPEDLYVLALDSQSTIATAQAFLQGLYPPTTLAGGNSSSSNSAAAAALDPSSVAANGTYIPNPLDGYQYVQMHTANTYDPEFIYLAGHVACPAWTSAAYASFSSPSTSATRFNTQPLYRTMQPLLSSVLPDPESWDYLNAYDIYDYLDYVNAHNGTAAALLNSSEYMASDNVTALDELRWLADQQQRGYFTNLTAVANTTSSASLPEEVTGSVSTIAGNTLAAKLLSQLQLALSVNSEAYKLSLLVGDFGPLLSLFALLGLPNINSNFNGIPDYASSLVFEVFSMTNNSMSMAFPDVSDLWVQVYFRNGTEAGGANDDKNGDYQSYPILGRGPSETEMPWSVFEDMMMTISMGAPKDWCEVCGAQTYFCPYFEALTSDGTEPAALVPKRRGGISAVVAGVVGAIVALVVAGLIFAAVMLLAGVRFVKRTKSEEVQKRDLAGFKGSAKLASDQDLSLPKKGGMVVGATVERESDDVKGHERVGSWEMKGNKELDEDGRSVAGHDPFADPVRPDERV